MLVQSTWASIGPKCTIYSHVDRQMGPLSCMVGLVPLAPNLYMVSISLGEGSYKYGAWLPRVGQMYQPNYSGTEVMYISGTHFKG